MDYEIKTIDIEYKGMKITLPGQTLGKIEPYPPTSLNKDIAVTFSNSLSSTDYELE
jgi:hypothetical protein